MITQLTPDMHGKSISCKIQDRLVQDAKVVLENGDYFITQNMISGSSCNDKLGYKFS